MIQVLTCTHNRLVAFEQCIKYVVRQTVPPDRWIIVSEDQYAYDLLASACDVRFHETGSNEFTIVGNIGGIDTLLVRRTMKQNEPPHTVNLNMIRGLLECSMTKQDQLIIMEDDDWYMKDYIETCVRDLKSFPVRGMRNNVYYNFNDRKLRTFMNASHSSLASTAIRGDMIPQLMGACCSALAAQCSGHDAFADLLFWQRCNRNTVALYDDLRVVGIKGFGNHASLDRGVHWNAFADIKSLIGDDATFYESLHD